MLPEDNILNEKVLSTLISHASSALRLSDRQIKEKFSQYPHCVMDFYEKKERGRAIEIRFDDEQTSITCSFNVNNRCDFAFIYPDHLNDLTAYVNYFNSVYEYDYIGCKWILPNGYLSQKKLKDGICFMINC